MILPGDTNVTDRQIAQPMEKCVGICGITCTAKAILLKSRNKVFMKKLKLYKNCN